MNLKEIWKLYKSKIFASLGAFAFIISGLIIYELKEFNNVNVEEAAAPVKSQANLQSQDINHDAKIFENFKYESDYEREREQANLKSQEQYIQVYITGAVKNSDVYKIKAGSRLNDLVKAAGGLTMTADREAINLAEILNTDGVHIQIPSKSETQKNNMRTNNSFIFIHPDKNKNSNSNLKAQTKTKAQAKSAKNIYEKVNINTAGLEELTKLKGIGPALAQRILDYRNQHGSFKSVNDLKRVRGIGNAKLKALSGQVILN
ncbi:MAG: helix-hairpin-helix domain-containing protein [Synergistaceae bacterium]|nr:helix-hairpin-helix domain-containing protein [Synergistaceae bacterium]